MNRAAAFLTTLFLLGSDRLASARKDRGATAVEYGLLVGLIAVVIIVAVGLLGGQLNSLFDGRQRRPARRRLTRTAPSRSAGAAAFGLLRRTTIWRDSVQLRGRDRGAAAVEFALILPLLVVLVFGITEFGRAYFVQTTLSGAARDGVRVMALQNDKVAARAAVEVGGSRRWTSPTPRSSVTPTTLCRSPASALLRPPPSPSPIQCSSSPKSSARASRSPARGA